MTEEIDPNVLQAMQESQSESQYTENAHAVFAHQERLQNIVQKKSPPKRDIKNFKLKMYIKMPYDTSGMYMLEEVHYNTEAKFYYYYDPSNNKIQIDKITPIFDSNEYLIDKWRIMSENNKNKNTLLRTAHEKLKYRLGYDATLDVLLKQPNGNSQYDEVLKEKYDDEYRNHIEESDFTDLRDIFTNIHIGEAYNNLVDTINNSNWIYDHRDAYEKFQHLLELKHYLYNKLNTGKKDAEKKDTKFYNISYIVYDQYRDKIILSKFTIDDKTYLTMPICTNNNNDIYYIPPNLNKPYLRPTHIIYNSDNKQHYNFVAAQITIKKISDHADIVDVLVIYNFTVNPNINSYYVRCDKWYILQAAMYMVNKTPYEINVGASDYHFYTPEPSSTHLNLRSTQYAIHTLYGILKTLYMPLYSGTAFDDIISQRVNFVNQQKNQQKNQQADNLRGRGRGRGRGHNGIAPVESPPVEPPH